MGLEQGGADIFGEAKGAEQLTQTQILEAIKTAVENPPAPPAPEGGATEQNQIEGLGIILFLKAILMKIAFPSWFDPTANAIRNQVQSGTITTVTTVTTITGLTNLDGYQSKLLVINQNISAWAGVVRSRIS